MSDCNDDDSLERMLKSAFKPVKAPPELKKKLLERLVVESDIVTAGASVALRDKPRIWIPIAVAIIAAIIGYGIWLSANFSATLLP